MIITTLIVCFLLAFLPLVISAFSFRYAANVFSKAILTLSAMSFLIGLAQFGLLLGLSYQHFSPPQMQQAQLALQYVSIAGGAIMIVAGCLWVGYFRLLMKSKSTAKQAVRPVVDAQIQPVTEAAPRPAPRKRRKKSEPEPDWFSDEAPDARVFKLAAVTTPKNGSRRRSAVRTGGAEAQRD